MNVLNIEHVSKVFGEKKVLDKVSCGIQEGDRIGIIGINGTGKTTLLKMLAGLEEPDEGRVVKKSGFRLAYLPQNPEFPEGVRVLSYVMQDAGPEERSAESAAKSMLNRLGITEHEKLLEQLSGGQRKRAALARVLSSSFDALILDEPTNHLDDGMISWLEDYLSKFRGVVILVTHDRYFLDRVANRIVELDRGRLYSYDADYSGFLEKKAAREEMELASERKRRSVLRMELEWAQRGCRARSTKQKARLERLEALKGGAGPAKGQNVEIGSVQARMGKKTIELRHVCKSYKDKKIVEDFNYIVLKNQRLGIIGPNGCGKSTLLKIIAGEIRPDSGEVETGETISIGYYAQETPDMETEQRVIDYIRETAEYIQTQEGRISASQMLERFLFTPDMQYAPVSKLSGGEKRRLYLLRVLCTPVNVLILDEPGNDLDIPTLTILEDYLNSFPGIVITVSHDRYFLDNVADRIFAFEGEGRLRQYEGGYTDYLKAVKEEESAGQKMPGRSGENKKGGEKDWKQNRPVKLKFTYSEQKEYEGIEEEIEAIEGKITALEEEMLKNATNSAKLTGLVQEKEEAERELEGKMDRWVYLNDLAEKIRLQNGPDML